MSETKFRTLRADEIEVRVGSINEKGATLLLYKDARVDMNILDESGVKWKRTHELINGNLFCTISVWDNEIKEWIGRQDVGVESNTEKEKGQASDAFKRAGFNFGIGRELYTAPFTWINADSYSGFVNGKTPQGKDKYATYDKFSVTKIEYDENKSISFLSIKNNKSQRVVFNWSSGKVASTEPKANKEFPVLEVAHAKGKYVPSDNSQVSDDQKMQIAKGLRKIYRIESREEIEEWLFNNWHNAITTQAQAQELIDHLSNEIKEHDNEAEK